jgi:hypothetical protein
VPRRPRQTALVGSSACAKRGLLERKVPGRRQLSREALGSMVATLQPAVQPTRHVRDGRDVGPRDRVDHDLRRPTRKPAQAALLPCGHDLPDRLVVLDRGTRTREREPPAAAFRAPPHRPGGGRTAALADRRSDAPQRRPAAAAHVLAGEGADQAPLRQQQVEHTPTLERDSCRIGVRSMSTQSGEYEARSGRPCRRRMRLSASSSWSRSPMSCHSPGKR